jgi:hypothetical protein
MRRSLVGLSPLLRSTMAIMAPSGGPLKMDGLQGKSRRGLGVRALWRQRAAHLPFCRRKKYYPNGGRGLRPHHGVGFPGGPRGRREKYCHNATARQAATSSG